MRYDRFSGRTRVREQSSANDDKYFKNILRRVFGLVTPLRAKNVCILISLVALMVAKAFEESAESCRGRGPVSLCAQNKKIINNFILI